MERGIRPEVNTSFEQYIDPSQQLRDRIVTAPSVVVEGELPPMPEVTVKS